MEISKEEIEAVKRSHDLKEVIASYGVALKKKGSNYVGLCPFHEEKDPSFIVNPTTNLYHCFGCNAGGDVIGFVAKREGIGFKEAIERLSRRQTDEGRGTQKGKANGLPSNPSTVAHRPSRLLNRIVSFYHTTFLEDGRAMAYLKGRGIADNSIFENFHIGFANGTLLNTIPQEGDIPDALREIGILNAKGRDSNGVSP